MKKFSEVGLEKEKVLEIFIVANFFFLIFDILYAHSINSFSHPGEWIPLVLCVVSTLVLGINWYFKKQFNKNIIILIGTCSLMTGLAGVIYHLESQFFQNQSLKSLIYTAPFIAPLSFSALGFLLFLNLLLSSLEKDWGRWVIWLSYLGFLGNFLLSLCDHEQNSFYYWTEWIPVISSSLIIGVIPFFLSPKRNDLIYKASFIIVGVQFIVGLLGAFMHIISLFKYTSIEHTLLEKIKFGAPLMAPLLFCNLAFLMFIGMLAHESSNDIIQIYLPKFKKS